MRNLESLDPIGLPFGTLMQDSFSQIAIGMKTRKLRGL
jgi:hypothetical protein